MTRKVIKSSMKGHAKLYSARKRIGPIHPNRKRALLRITRHHDLSPAERIVLLHLCFFARHYIPVNDRAGMLDISESGFEEARSGLGRRGIIEHSGQYNASIPKDGYTHYLNIPIAEKEDDQYFHKAAETLWEAKGGTNAPPKWWWQAFRRLAEHERIKPQGLQNLVFQCADHANTKAIRKIHNPNQVKKNLSVLKRLRDQMMAK